MKLRKVTLVLVFLLAPGFILAVLSNRMTENAFGQSDQPPPMFHKMRPSGIAGDEDHLFVMAGGKIMVYQISDMSLLKSVDLPDPPADALPPPPDFSRSYPPPFPHPHGGGPQGLWTGNHFLFVLAGPMIYEYSTPDLTLVSSTQLPKPELPTQGN